MDNYPDKDKNWFSLNQTNFANITKRMKKKQLLKLLFLYLLPISYLLLINFPIPLFGYSYDIDNYHLYSDNAFSRKIEPLMDTVSHRLRQSEIYSNNNYHIAFCNKPLRFAFIANVSYNAFGITQRLSNFIVLNRVDIDRNLVFRNGDNQQMLTSTLIHELTHVLINKHYGIKSFMIPEWKVEGYCEYMAQESSYNIDKGFTNFKNRVTDNSPSYSYCKYRLYVSYLIAIKKMTFDQIVENEIELEALTQEIISNLKQGIYVGF